jgi:MFS transporter, PAT family, beta-lactamase induction signal transducer AmpG
VSDQVATTSARPTMTSLEKLSLFACLYFAQGLPYGFFTQAMPVYLREAKATLTQIGGASLLTLPWAIKFLWAPLADRYGFPKFGLRRSWIVPLQLLSVIALVTVSFMEPASSLLVVLIAFLVCNFIAAAQDVATDGLAVDLLKAEERGWANGIQVGAYRIGMIAGGSAMLVVLSLLGWQATMLAMAACLVLTSLPVLFFRENDILGGLNAAVDDRLKREPLQDVKEFLLSPDTLKWLGILLIYKVSHQASSAMMRPWLVDNGYSLTEIGALTGLFGSGAGLVGAVLGGWVASRFDRFRSLGWLALLQAVATATYLIPVMTEHAVWKIALATMIDNGVSGIATVTLFAAMMERCRPHHSASDYTLQASLVVISQTAASALAGTSADFFGYSRHFAIVVSFSLVIVAYVTWALRSMRVTTGNGPSSRALKSALGLVLSIGTLSIGLAPSRAEAFEVGVGFGPFLPSRIGGVREVMNGWGARTGFPTSKGFFELEFYNAHSDGSNYHTLAFDYRLDVMPSGPNVPMPVFFLLGFHGDYYSPRDIADYRQSGGWHYGGGVRIPLGGATSGNFLRADFKHRFSPGSSLIVLVGFSFSTGPDGDTKP